MPKNNISKKNNLKKKQKKDEKDSKQEKEDKNKDQEIPEVNEEIKKTSLDKKGKNKNLPIDPINEENPEGLTSNGVRLKLKLPNSGSNTSLNNVNSSQRRSVPLERVLGFENGNASGNSNSEQEEFDPFKYQPNGRNTNEPKYASHYSEIPSIGSVDSRNIRTEFNPKRNVEFTPMYSNLNENGSPERIFTQPKKVDPRDLGRDNSSSDFKKKVKYTPSKY